jgi:hypothetical protein
MVLWAFLYKKTQDLEEEVVEWRRVASSGSHSGICRNSLSMRREQGRHCRHRFRYRRCCFRYRRHYHYHCLPRSPWPDGHATVVVGDEDVVPMSLCCDLPVRDKD